MGGPVGDVVSGAADAIKSGVEDVADTALGPVDEVIQHGPDAIGDLVQGDVEGAGEELAKGLGKFGADFLPPGLHGKAEEVVTDVINGADGPQAGGVPGPQTEAVQAGGVEGAGGVGGAGQAGFGGGGSPEIDVGGGGTPAEGGLGGMSGQELAKLQNSDPGEFAEKLQNIDDPAKKREVMEKLKDYNQSVQLASKLESIANKTQQAIMRNM